MYSCGPPHMAGQKQDGQHEHTFNNYVRIRDVVQKTCLRWWTIGKSGERGSWISVLPAKHDDDDDDIVYYFENSLWHFKICIYNWSLCFSVFQGIFCLTIFNIQVGFILPYIKDTEVTCSWHQKLHLPFLAVLKPYKFRGHAPFCLFFLLSTELLHLFNAPLFTSSVFPFPWRTFSSLHSFPLGTKWLSKLFFLSSLWLRVTSFSMIITIVPYVPYIKF